MAPAQQRVSETSLANLGAAESLPNRDHVFHVNGIVFGERDVRLFLAESGNTLELLQWPGTLKTGFSVRVIVEPRKTRFGVFP